MQAITLDHKTSRANLVNYLIDCIGYSEQDCQDMTTGELMDRIDNQSEFIKYTLGV